MKWLSQVVHVAAKDARMTRWLAAGYVVLVGLAAFQLGGGVLPALWSALALLLALIAVAQVVQDDPAIRDDAFWVSRPLSPAAVYAAKALLIVLAAAIAVAGQAVLLARYSIVGPTMLRSFAGDPFTWLAVVAAAVVLAAATRDLRGFAIALIGVLVCWAFGGFLLEDRLKHLFTRPDWVTPVLVLFGSLAIAGYQYVSGRRLRAAGLAVVLLTASTVLAWAPGPGQESPRTAAAPVLPPALRPASIVVREGMSGQLLGGGLAFQVVGGSPDLEYILGEGSLKLRAPGGSFTPMKLARTRLSAELPALRQLPGVRWASDGSPVDGWMAVDLHDQVRYGLPRDRQSDLAAGRLMPDSVRGVVEGREARVGARLPLREGASVTRPGRRLRVVTVTRYGRLPDVLPPAAGIRVELEVSRVDDPNHSGFFDGPGAVKFAILDRAQRTVFPLETLSSGGGNGGTFLLPQPAATFTYRLLWRQPADSPPAPSDSLELLVLDWRPVGSYPVSLPVEPRAAGVPGPSTAAPSAKKLEPLLRGER